MPEYQMLKTELTSIAKLIEIFPENLRQRVFDLLIAEYLGKDGSLPRKRLSGQAGVIPLGVERGKAETATKSGASSKKRTAKESYSLDRELDLHGKGNTKSFKVFVEEKRPKSSAEFNAVAVYYLAKVLNVADVTLNQIYTCYAEVKRRPAGFFKQSLIDTKNKQGYIDLTESGTVIIPHRGISFVEHDLPATEKPGKK